MDVGLEEYYLHGLQVIMRQHIDTKVWQPVVFGSRASGTVQKL